MIVSIAKNMLIAFNLGDWSTHDDWLPRKAAIMNGPRHRCQMCGNGTLYNAFHKVPRPATVVNRAMRPKGQMTDRRVSPFK